MRVVKTVFTGKGECEADLMENVDSGSIHFRQYFETTEFNNLEFENNSDLLKYLDSKNDSPEMPYFICGDEIYYQESIGDRTLRYFGTIKE